jgi:hypothetical protein
MGKRISGPLPAEAGRLKAEILAWRETRAKVGPMPAALWTRAVRLAAVHGNCRVAKAIGVDYSALRDRGEIQASPSQEPVFLEIPSAMVLAGVPVDGERAGVGGRISETQVDLALADGSRLRMTGASLDAAAIVAAFMGRR